MSLLSCMQHHGALDHIVRRFDHSERKNQVKQIWHSTAVMITFAIERLKIADVL